MVTDGKCLSDHGHSYPKSRDAIASKKQKNDPWLSCVLGQKLKDSI